MNGIRASIAAEPLLAAALAGGGVILVLLLLVTQRAGRSARASEHLARHLARLGEDVAVLGRGQAQLSGNLQLVSESQAKTQLQVVQTMESRLAEVQRQTGERMAEMREQVRMILHGQSEKTSTSLTRLQERLAVIDRAQDNISRLSNDVLGLQDILSNKQRRGLFGEIQLADIVGRSLPPDAFTMQATLSNGRRADCLIHLPDPPGPLVIDAKFPLEAYEALCSAAPEDQPRALKAFGQSVRLHIRAISERYIVDGETADGAVLFLPSEAIYAELHAKLPQIVREGFDARVWIVSPTTCMATLNTLRAILKDARMREQAGAIRAAIRAIHRDVELIGERAGKLETHLRQAGEDASGLMTAAQRAGRRAERLEGFDFETPEAADGRDAKV